MKHSVTALRSSNIRVKQYDTIYVYSLVQSITQRVARLLEAEGYRAVSIPSALPVDMSNGKLGMIGDVDWRRAGVLAGIGIYGRSGLLVTKQYGPRVRLGGVLTNAVLDYEEGATNFEAAMEQICGSCRKCVDACPTGALKGDGTIDKRKCGSKLFEYGFRGLAKFVESLMDADPESRRNYVKSYTFREIWQSLITGYNYYCWECQAVCPIGG